MADIFISYARADREKIEKLADALEREGYSVWWDRQIETGAAFSNDIERELNGAKAVIVCWSGAANNSDWVKDEASAAKEQGKLAPIRLDAERAPIGFRQYQTLDLSGWKGGIDEEAFGKLADAMAARVKAETAQGPDHFKAPGTSQKSPLADPKIWAGAMVIAALIVLTLMRNGAGTHDPVAPTDIAEMQRSGDAAAGVGLAVLPFVNMSSDPEQEYFTDGLTEELLNWLANVEGLNVAGRTSSFQYKGKTDDLRLIGERLGVRYLLEGSVRRSGDALRITVQLIEAESGFHIWSETYDRNTADFFAIQDEIARLAVTELLGAIPQSGAANPAAVGDVDPHAHELYLAGRALWASRDTVRAFAKFRMAVEADSDHALAQAYVAVICAYSIYNGYNPGVEDGNVRAVMNAALARAIALQPQSADVLFAQGWVVEFAQRLPADHNRQGSEGNDRAVEFYDRALRANPRHIEAMQARMRNTQDEAEQIERAERILEIDAGHYITASNLAVQYLDRGDVARAISLIERTTLMFPDTPRAAGMTLFRLAGNIERAGAHTMRDWESVDNDELSQWMRIALFADLGATSEAAFLMQFETETATSSEAALIGKFMQAKLNGDRAAVLKFAEALETLKNKPIMSSNILAQALLAQQQPQRALDVTIEIRPGLVGPDEPRIQINKFNSIGDREAFTAAIALDKLGRRDEATKIWNAVIEAMKADARFGWRSHLGRSVALAWLGERQEALAEIQTAYDKGFRFVRSYDCEVCIGDGFYSANGYFEPLFGEPEFQRIVKQIETDNAETVLRLDQKFGVLKRVREMMAAAERSKD